MGWSGRRAGMGWWDFSFSFDKRLVSFQTCPERDGGVEKALGSLFVAVGVGLSVYMTFYITRLIECL